MYQLIEIKKHTNQWGVETGLIATKATINVLPYNLFDENVTARIDYYDDNDNVIGVFEYATIKTPDDWASDDSYLIDAFKKIIGLL